MPWMREEKDLMNVPKSLKDQISVDFTIKQEYQYRVFDKSEDLILYG